MAMPDAIFRILPKGYESGAIALTWLAPAYFSFSLFNIVNTLLMSAGRAGQALIVGLITVILILGFLMGMLRLIWISVDCRVNVRNYSKLHKTQLPKIV